jgi:hypothetical protein
VKAARESLALGEQPAERKNSMNNDQTNADEDDLLPEYDLSQLQGEVRGKYYAQYRAGTNVVFLEPDVRAGFPTDEAVNQALRSLLQSDNAAK